MLNIQLLYSSIIIFMVFLAPFDSALAKEYQSVESIEKK